MFGSVDGGSAAGGGVAGGNAAGGAAGDRAAGGGAIGDSAASGVVSCIGCLVCVSWCASLLQCRLQWMACFGDAVRFGDAVPDAASAGSSGC